MENEQRCETCKHFDEKYSECDNPALIQTAERTGVMYDSPFFTPGPDFGCTLWEAKDDAGN